MTKYELYLKKATSKNRLLKLREDCVKWSECSASSIAGYELSVEVLIAIIDMAISYLELENRKNDK
jgi:hypothetical protein